MSLPMEPEHQQGQSYLSQLVVDGQPQIHFRHCHSSTATLRAEASAVAASPLLWLPCAQEEVVRLPGGFRLLWKAGSGKLLLAFQSDLGGACASCWAT